MDYSRIKPVTIESIKLYVKDGTHPGGFLEAVLSNNLQESFGRADIENRQFIFEIVRYCYNEIPSSCWGSQERFERWLRVHSNENENAIIDDDRR